MLDPALLRGQLHSVADRLRTRGYVLDTDAIEQLEAQRKSAQTETQELQNLRNTRSKAIGRPRRKARISALMDEVAGIGDKLKANEQQLADIQSRIANIALGIPNLADASVPRRQGRKRKRRTEKVGHAAHVRIQAEGSRRTRRAQRLARRRNRRQTFRRALHRSCAASSRSCIARSRSSCSICTRANTVISNATCR